jgi:hypothetical protein
MSTTTPLHIATIRGRRLRFFKTPRNDGRPDFPWHSLDDLLCVLDLDEASREFSLRKQKRSEFPVEAVAIDEGIVSIAPHYAALGWIGVISQVWGDPDNVEDAYIKASSEAANLLTGALGVDSRLNWMLAASARHDDVALSHEGHENDSLREKPVHDPAAAARAWADQHEANQSSQLSFGEALLRASKKALQDESDQAGEMLVRLVKSDPQRVLDLLGAQVPHLF